MEKFNFFKGVFFLKELLESWRCRLELDVCEWGGGKEGGGGEKLHEKDSGLNWKRDVGGERLVRRTDRQSEVTL